MSALGRILNSRPLNTRYVTIAVSPQQHRFRLAALAGVALTLVGLFVAATDAPWYLGAIAVVLAVASVIVSQPSVPIVYAAYYLVLWVVWAPRAVSVMALVAALGFVLWHGALSIAGSVPLRGRLAADTMRRWTRRLSVIAAVVAAAFAVATVLDDPARPPSRAAVVIASLLVIVVALGALLAARRRTRTRVPGE